MQLSSLLFFVATASAHVMDVITHEGSNCSGKRVLGYIDHATRHCFNVGGNSISDVHAGNADNKYTNCLMTTWSGRDCRGSSLSWTAANQCRNVPFASYSLSCCNDVYICKPTP